MTSETAKTDARTNKANTARLFFAIQPNKTIQTTLGNIAKQRALQSGGRPIKPENIHLTLLFLGPTPVNCIEILKAASDSICAQSFELTIRNTRYWKHNQIIYASADSYPAALFTLEDKLKTAVRETGFSFDDRAFKPHITLIRKATLHTANDFENPIRWPVTEWRLIRSIQTERGIRYHTLNRWQLG